MSQRLPLVALIGLLAVASVACSGSSAAHSTSTPAAPSASPTNAPPTATPTPDLGPTASGRWRSCAGSRSTSAHASPVRPPKRQRATCYRDDPDIHTPADSVDRVDAASLRDTAAVAFATLRALNGG